MSHVSLLPGLLVAAAIMRSATSVAGEGSGAAPVAVLQIDRPWQGTQPPEFVLYESGLAIQREFVFRGPDKYSAEVLSPDRLAALMARLRVFASGARWASWYDRKPTHTDQATRWIFLRLDGKTIVSAVYGDACAPAGAGGAPINLCGVLDELAHIRLADAKPWTPEEVSVTLLPEDGGKGWKKLPWPKEWPGLSSSRATRESDGRYTIRLDGKFLPEVDAFWERVGGYGVVKLGGKTWAGAYQVPFPRSEEWEKQFDAVRSRLWEAFLEQRQAK